MASSLPPELIYAIVESLYHTKEGRNNHSSLLSCSLVSRTWAAVAQKLLFRSPVLQSLPRGSSFDLAITRDHLNAPLLAAHVRILNVTVDIPSGALPPILFAHILAGCVRLYELRISAPAIHSLDDVTLTALSNIPPIKALSILRTGVQSTLLYQLLSLLPSVRHLRLISELHATPPSQPAQFRLYELITHRAPHPDALAWLLGASHSTLRILEIWDMCSRVTMRTLMRTHGSQLRSLRLAHFNHQAVEIIRECSNLEELVLWHVPTLTSVWDLPPSIEHFAFRDPVHSHAFTLDSIVKALTKLPKLRKVTCDENATRHADFSRLSKVCADARVELNANALHFTVVRLLA